MLSCTRSHIQLLLKKTGSISFAFDVKIKIIYYALPKQREHPINFTTSKMNLVN